MSFNPLAFVELFVVFAFVVGWAVLELVGLRLDKRRAAEKAALEANADEAADGRPSPSPTGAPREAWHPEREQGLDPGLSEPRQ